MERVLPTHYFHVVFTLPEELRLLAMVNRAVVFNMLFASASEALMDLAADPRFIGATPGITAVLHTWTRELLFHPHLHCIVTGGGLSPDHDRWISAPRNFLFPVRVLGDLFRGKFLHRLIRAHASGALRLDGPAAPLADAQRFGRLRKKLYAKRWVVYCKRPFGGPEQVFTYLGQYTHRIGISDHRLISLDDDKVTFRIRGENTLALHPHEFLRRFLLHLLPDGFVKKRHYGLLSPGNIRRTWAAASFLLEQQQLPEDRALQPPNPPSDYAELLLALTGKDIRRCPECGGPLTRHLIEPLLNHPRFLDSS